MSPRQPAKGKEVVVVGLGYVGLPLALLVQKNEFHAIGLDNDKAKVTLINQGKAPFYDPEVTTQLKTHRLEATTDPNVIKKADIVIVCVPTPLDNDSKPDLKILEDACTTVARHAKPGALLIVESTINPGVCDEILIPLIEQESGMKIGKQIMLAHCPERINPGDPRWNVSNIPRVIGGYDAKSLAVAAEFYNAIVAAPIHEMNSIIETEAVKLTENSFRDINIAFVNELARSFDKLGINTVRVIEGAATKPFSFLPHYPGIGVGGHCIPVDPLYLINYAAKQGFDHRILKLARDTNDSMPAYGVGLIESLSKSLGLNIEDLKIGVLGLSYKENVGDLRESPSLEVIEILKDKNLDIAVHDPHIQLANGPKQYKHLDALINWADCLIVCTAHQEYLGITEASLAETNVKIVVDGRNCLNKVEFLEGNIIYHGIGVR
jgi:UDP-N-acetyl-D-glucosamine dehydrogenase